MKKSVAILFLLLAQFNASQASAAIVYSSTVTFNNMGESSSFGVNNLTNQTGLKNSYTSGVTDFATATAASNTYTQGTTNASWRGNASAGTLEFALEETINLTSLAWWNGFGSGQIETQVGREVNSFTVFTSTVADFSTITNVGTYTNAKSVGTVNNAVTPNTFDLITITQAQYIRVVINSNHGNQSLTEMGEIAFGGTAVPEPTTFGLLSVFGIGLVTARRRRR